MMELMVAARIAKRVCERYGTPHASVTWSATFWYWPEYDYCVVHIAFPH